MTKVAQDPPRRGYVPRNSLPGFDVTATIGRVVFGEGEQSQMEAALALIGRHGKDGHYEFPAEWGGTVWVDVEGSEPPRERGDAPE